MTRVVLCVVLVSWIGTSPAFAAGPDSTSPGSPLAAAPVAIKYDFSAKAAGIDHKAQTPARQTLLRTALPAPPQAAQTTQATQATQGKSIWRTPWPYLIAGGAVVALVLISENKEGGLY